MTKRRPLLAAAAALCLCGAATAQDKPSVSRSDLADMEACLAKPDVDPRTCVGQQSERCMSEPEGQSTVSMDECIMEEEAVWDQLLNERYAAVVSAAKAVDKDLADRSEPDAFQSLQKAQRAWITYRDAECDRIYAYWRGGTIRSTNYASCMLDMTSDRVIDLAPVEN